MIKGTHNAPVHARRSPLPAAIGRFRFLQGLVAGCFLFVTLLASAQSVPKEYQLKAAFLYNFTKFVEWPTNRFADKDTPIIIGVVGQNPFGKELANAVQDRTQGGRTYLVTNLTSIAEGAAVHLLFVPQGQDQSITEELAKLHLAGVLTVGESEAFAAASGMIIFTTETDKIRFEINQEQAELSGLKISSKLLQLAKTVRRKPATTPTP